MAEHHLTRHLSLQEAINETYRSIETSYWPQYLNSWIVIMIINNFEPDKVYQITDEFQRRVLAKADQQQAVNLADVLPLASLIAAFTQRY